MTYFGVDQNGMPTADSPRGRRSGRECPQGQRFDATIGTCVEANPQLPPRSNRPPPSPPPPSPQNRPSVEDIYSQYRRNTPRPHAGSLDELVRAYNDAGYRAGRYMYGNTPSLNEIEVEGQKRKVSVGDVTDPNANWYNWGTPDDRPSSIRGGDISAYLSRMFPQGRPFELENYERPPTPGGYRYEGGLRPQYNKFGFTRFKDFAAPSAMRQTTEDLIQKMLTSTSLSPAVLAQMKEGQKDTILGGADQLKQSILQQAGSRLDSGALRSMLANADLSSLGEISGAYRDLDVRKALQDRTDQMGAVNLSKDYQQQLLNEFLNQQAMRRHFEQGEADEGYRGYRTEDDRYRFDRDTGLREWMAGNENELSRNQQAFNQWAARQGLRLSGSGQQLDLARLLEMMRQFNIGNEFDVARWLAG